MTPPQFDNIPLFLRDTPRWVMWQAVPRADGKITKVPKRRDGRNASSTDPSTWCTFEEARAAYERAPDRFSGVGLVLDGSDGLVGVDLDHCIEVNVLSGEEVYSALATETLTTMPGYWEISPSGEGVRGFIVAPGVVPPQKQVRDEDGARECYAAGRYLTVTGDLIKNDPQDGAPGALKSWLSRWMGSQGQGVVTPLVTSPVVGDGSLADFIADGAGGPVDGWTLERVRAEIVPHLDPEGEYDQWLEVGAALHHQGGGDQEWFDLWESVYAGSSKYTGPEYSRPKWDSFGGAPRPVTLRTLLKKTSDARRAAAKASVVVAKSVNVQNLTDRILGCLDQAAVADVAAEIASDASISDLDREALAHRILAQLRTLFVKVPIASARKMVKLTATALAAARNVAPFPDVSPQGVLQSTEANLAVLCMNEGVTIRYNVISKDQELIIPGRGFTKDNRANASLAVLSSMCAKANLNTGAAALRGLITAQADANQYNPVLQWMESKAWDGKDRVADLDATIVSHMAPALKRKILDHWLVQCVAAAAQGGLQVRGVLVFQGGQYQGKSRWLASLAPEHLHAVSIGITLDPRDKDLVKQALSFWLVELGELDATFRKSDIAHLKGFLSRTEDVLRLPYAQAESKFDRRTVFFGTVNDPDFLNDVSGNTRFWTIPVETVNHEHTVDMQQLWAQVLADWRTGRKHYPTAEIMREFEAHNTAFVAEDPTFVRIANGFPWPQEGDADRSGWVWWSATEVLRHLNMECRGPAEARRAGAALRKLNGNANRVLQGVVRHQVPPAETPL